MGNRFSSPQKRSTTRRCCCFNESIDEDCDSSNHAEEPETLRSRTPVDDDEIAQRNGNDQGQVTQSSVRLVENVTSFALDSRNVDLSSHNVQTLHVNIGRIEVPQTENLIIGDGGNINNTREETEEMRERSIVVLQKISDNVQNMSDNQFSRRDGQEFFQRLEQIIKKEADDRSKRWSATATDCRPRENKHRSSNIDPFLLENQNFKRMSRSGRLDEVLQHCKWSQHACTQNLYRTVLCEIQECKNQESIKEKVTRMEEAIKNALDKETLRAESSFLRAGGKNDGISIVQRNNSIKLLKENRENALNKVEYDLKKIVRERVNSVNMRKRPSRKSHGGDNNQVKKDAHAAAERFIKIITDKVISYVLDLLVFKVEENIIRFTFNCQKSNVIKAILEELPRKGFVDFMQYILYPNKYGKMWLQNFTNRKLFYEKTRGKHLYSTFASKEIEMIFQSIEKSIRVASSEHNIDDWVNRFLDQMHIEKVLPISAEDLHDVKTIENADLSSFLGVLKNRIAFMKDGTIQHFMTTTAETVSWKREANPYDKIKESLWGCCECCPFCKEPCKYTDKDHLEQELDHVCIQHRPLGVYGFLNTRQGTLVFENCHTLLNISDMGYTFYENESLRPCSEYKNEFPKWKIEPYQQTASPKYWMWFLTQYLSRIVEFYRAEYTPLPYGWNKVTIEDALSSLQIYS